MKFTAKREDILDALRRSEMGAGYKPDYWDAVRTGEMDVPDEYVRYTRTPEHDRRIANGDDFAGDAWRNEATGQIVYSVVGWDMNRSCAPSAP